MEVHGRLFKPRADALVFLLIIEANMGFATLATAVIWAPLVAPK